jgi:hypothetical protein
MVLSQPDFEIREFTGIVVSINPGFRFAYEEIVLDVTGKQERFMFYPEHGEFVMNSLRTGDEVTVKVNVNVKMRESFSKLKSEEQKTLLFFQRDYITGVKKGERWIDLKEKTEDSKRDETFVFLDKKVEQVFSFQGRMRAITFDTNKAAFVSWISKHYDPLKEVKQGDVVSFSGWRFSAEGGYQYPIENIAAVYSYYSLTKNKGILKSFLYKQNHVCIGAKFLSRQGEVAVSFPSDKAQDIIDFIKPEKDVYFYLHDFTIDNQLNPPELHALVQDKDTLFIRRLGFYGGADVKHEHKAVEVNGRITDVNRLQNGRVYSVIIDNSVYVEIDSRLEKQVTALLKRGKPIVAKGEERIKKAGEVYNRDYRIVTPSAITLEGKVYLLNQP